MKIFLSCICLIIALGSYSQDVMLIPYRQGKLWGYCDTSGNIKVHPVYDRVTFFQHYSSFAKVFQANKMSLINQYGKQILPFVNTVRAFAIINDLVIFRVKENNKYGVYSESGKLITPIIYDTILAASNYEEYKTTEGKIIAKKGNKFYLINLTSGGAGNIAAPKLKQNRNEETDNTNDAVTASGYEVTGDITKQKWFSKFSKKYSYSYLYDEFLFGKNNFAVFAVEKDYKFIGYVGENGVEYFKD